MANGFAPATWFVEEAACRQRSHQLCHRVGSMPTCTEVEHGQFFSKKGTLVDMYVDGCIPVPRTLN